MTELDLKLQELKRAFEDLKEENKRIKFSNALLEKELKEYRELDEQGLLLKLPCKVGDKTYHIIEDNMADPPIYISDHEIQDVSAKAVYFADDWWSFEEMREMNAYLNKAEAEKALEEMERECEHYVVMTNADRIRRMSDEELEAFIKSPCSIIKPDRKSCRFLCDECIAEWLKEKVE